MGVKWIIARLGLLQVLLLMSACSIYTAPGTTPAPVETPPDPAVITPPKQPEQRPAEPGVVAAYSPLIKQADSAAQRGDFEQALALLERAQRIAPASAEVYLAMARTHESRGDAAQARAIAERGLFYCRIQTECAALRAYTR